MSAPRSATGARRAIGPSLQGLVVGAIGLAGLLKLIDLGEFWRSLSTWRLVPSWAIDGLSIGVPAFEVCVAGLWLACGRRGLAVTLAMLGIGVFTAAFVVHLVTVGAPECNCYGVVQRFVTQKHQAGWTAVRNAGMVAALVVGVLVARAPTDPEVRGSGVGAARPDASSTCRRGFTAIELLLVVALVGVVVALTLPALRRVRLAAREALSLGNLRTHAATMTAYAGDNDDWFPFLADPEATYSVFRHNGVTATVPFFDVHLVWNFPLADEYDGGDHLHDSFRLPWWEQSQTTQYYLAHCLMTRPEFWRPETRTGPGQWRGCRASELLFPAAKGVIIEREPTDRPDWPPRPELGIRFSTGDGSARDHRNAVFEPPYFPNPTGQWTGSSYLESRTVMHTMGGVRGRDVR